MGSATLAAGSGPELDRKIVSLALPAISGFLGMILFDLANIFWIGRIGPQAVAGVAASGFLMWTFYAVMHVTASGCTALVAQYFGARNQAGAHQVVVESFWISLAISIVVMALFLPFLALPFHWMGLDEATRQQAESYFRIILWCFPVAYLYMLTGNIFNAYGDTRTSNWIMVGALALNMVLDPILIFGLLGFPRLEIGGAALATSICQFLGLVTRVAYLRRKEMIGPLAGFLRLPSGFAGRIVAIGAPNAITNFVWSVVYPFLTRLITPFGMAPLAAVGVSHRLESFPYFCGTGMGIALSALIGQAVGRGDHDEVRGLARRGMLITSLMMAPFVAAFLIAPEFLVGLLSTDPTTVAHGGRYLWIIGLGELFLGWELAFGGAFTGLGRTAPTLLITIPLTVGRIPMAMLFSDYLGMGLDGVWLAISLSTAGKGLGLAILWRRTMRGWGQGQVLGENGPQGVSGPDAAMV